MRSLSRFLLALSLVIGFGGLSITPAQADGCANPMGLEYDLSLLGGPLTISLPILTITGNVDIDWGDGTSQTVTAAGNITHTYGSSSSYTVTLCNNIYSFGTSGSVTPATGVEALTTVYSFGDMPLYSLARAFVGAINLTDVPAIIPSSVQKVDAMFRGATSLNDSDLSSWNTENIDSFSYLFFNASSLNQNLGAWNLSNATNLSYMFAGASSFNNGEDTGISNWDVGKVTDYSFMFQEASSFNQPIGGWNLGEDLVEPSRISLQGMFQDASIFNQPLVWDTSKVSNFRDMFLYASSFNQNIGGWDVSNVVTFKNMFFLASAFNNGGSADINNWGPFAPDTVFDYMFHFASAFNQPLNQWDTSNVVSMHNMFSFATSFDQDLSDWDLSGIQTTAGGSGMFAYSGNLSSVLSSSALSAVYYDRLLIGLSERLGGADPLDVTGLTLGAVGRVYTCNAVDARAALETAGMTITDAGISAVPAPILTNANPRDAGVDLSWEAAACNGVPVTVIRNEISFNNGQTWQTAAGTYTWVTAGGMINGNEYQIRVRVVTADGTSPASNMMTVVPNASSDVELFVVPDDQTIEAGTSAPGAGFYTFTLRTDSTSGTVVTPTLTSAPVCTSSYNASMTSADSPLTISCSGGSATGYTFNTTDTAVLTITDPEPEPEPIDLYVIPNNQTIELGSPTPDNSFYTYFILNSDNQVVAPAFTSAPVCTSTYNPSLIATDFPLDITCSGGVAEGYNIITFAEAELQLPDDVDDSDPGYGSTFTVIYDSSGATSGEVPIPAALVSQHGSYEVLSNFGGLVKPGYVFAGWTDGTRTYLPGEIINVGSNLKLSPVWMADTVAIGTFTPVGARKTQISWDAIDGALVYRVLVNGKLVYSGNSTEFAFKKLLGVSAKVVLEVDTADSTKVFNLDYSVVKRIKAIQINFATGFSTISSTTAKKLDALVKLIKLQGFENFIAIGYVETNSAVSTATAKARAKAMTKYLISKGVKGKFVVKRIVDKQLANTAILWIVK